MNNRGESYKEDVMKILMFGSGVIGSIFGLRFSKINQQVSMYARGERLKELNSKGLLYKENKEIKQADVRIISNLSHNEKYDFIFVTVRYDQIETALEQIKLIDCDNIITMVNNPNGYEEWEKVVGVNRIIPAFPGAGGMIENGVLNFKITPAFIQSTTFGELNGRKSGRIKTLVKLFKEAKIPYSISSNMDAWQKCHLALVLPLAIGIYKDGGDNFSTSKNKKALNYMSSTLKGNFFKLKAMGIKITPKRFIFLQYVPSYILIYLLKTIYNTDFAGTVICEHALNARGEMDRLEIDFQKVLATQH